MRNFEAIVPSSNSLMSLKGVLFNGLERLDRFGPFHRSFWNQALCWACARKAWLEHDPRGSIGHLSTAEGLWPVDGGAFDFKDIHISKIPVGIYFIRIQGRGLSPFRLFDYIGLANPHSAPSPNKFQVGIFQRAYEHYRKIVGIPHRQKIGKYISKGYPELQKDQSG